MGSTSRPSADGAPSTRPREWVPYQLPSLLSGHAAKLVIVAVAYFLTGQLGLLAAVPPGYATVIWPPSGIAVGLLLTRGRALWPGVFVGSFVLNAAVGGAYSDELGWSGLKLAVAASIAAGSSLQALVACWLVARLVGMPIHLKRGRDILLLFGLAGPASCLVAASIGVSALYLGGIAAWSSLWHNWWAWWTGDVFGIAVFLPLVLIAPGARDRLAWRGVPLSPLPVAALLVLILPLGLTFYAWQASERALQARSTSAFASLAQENEQAFVNRLASYDQGLLGGMGFIKGSKNVSANEWRAYVDALDLRKTFVGMLGLGLVVDVGPDKVADFLVRERETRSDFSIHPAKPTRPFFVITYIEPKAANAAAVGLNIAFEGERLKAALLARDTGLPAITKRIALVQDRAKSPGFLLLHPMYRPGALTDSVAHRRDAFTGWVYAPLIASDVVRDLSIGQGRSFNLRIYEGEQEASSQPIYDSGASHGTNLAQPAYSARKTIDVMQRRWTLVWTSTHRFERSVGKAEPVVVLLSGLVFTALFGVLLFLYAHRAETVRALVEQKTRELAERETLFRLLAEHTSDMISRVTLDGTRLYASPACQKLLGYAPSELLLINDKCDVHPEDRPRLAAEYTMLAAGIEDESIGIYKLTRKDGSPVQAEVVLQLVRDRTTGDPLELVVTKRDVNLREQRSEELKQAKIDAETANEAKTAFLATMSHEIRTPLNAIIGFAELLLEEPDLSEVTRRNAERIRGGGDALLMIVNDILDLTQAEKGGCPLDLQPFALPLLVDECLALVEKPALTKSLALHVEMRDQFPSGLLGDEGRLRQILLNLLNNAIKFTPEGAVTLRIGYAPDGGANHVLFEIIDTGIGIAAADLGVLFQRFRQVDGTIRRTYGGTGLGLAISKMLVELMGGRIGVRSDKGIGSTFWFSVELPSAPLVLRTPALPVRRETSRSLDILLVEDVRINQELACAILRAQGHRVDVVGDGAESIMAVEHFAYDLVLMDIQMPCVDGYSATRAIRTMPTPKRFVPIVAMTANVLKEQIAFAHAAGMDDVLPKPLSLVTLKAFLDRAERDSVRRAPDPDAFDRAVLAKLIDAIGEAKVRPMLGLLARTLAERFTGDFAPERVSSLKAEAHASIAGAAMLGFTRFAKQCRTFIDASDEAMLPAHYDALRRELYDAVRGAECAAGSAPARERAA